jgi:hypothetical protein
VKPLRHKSSFGPMKPVELAPVSPSDRWSRVSKKSFSVVQNNENKIQISSNENLELPFSNFNSQSPKTFQGRFTPTLGTFNAIPSTTNMVRPRAEVNSRMGKPRDSRFKEFNIQPMAFGDPTGSSRRIFGDGTPVGNTSILKIDLTPTHERIIMSSYGNIPSEDFGKNSGKDSGKL